MNATAYLDKNQSHQKISTVSPNGSWEQVYLKKALTGKPFLSDFALGREHKGKYNVCLGTT